MDHNYWACALQPGSCNNLRPHTLEPMLWTEATAVRSPRISTRKQTPLLQLEKSSHSTENPVCYATLCYAKSLQSCLTLCDPIDGSPPGSPVPGILQARILEWVAISFSNAWKWKVKAKSLSRVQLLGTPWTVAHQTPPSMEFSRQEYWSGLPLPLP